MAANVGMKKARRKKRPDRVVSKLEFMRMQMASAESIWKEAKEHFARAKRRRKLAKLLAKRAKTEVKRAKQQLAKMREALALAEAKAITETRPGPRRRARKVQPSRTASKVPTSTHKKAAKGARLIRTPATPAPAPMPVLAIIPQDERVPQTTPAIPETDPGHN